MSGWLSVIAVSLNIGNSNKAVYILQAKANAHGGKVSVMASYPGIVALLNNRGCNN